MSFQPITDLKRLVDGHVESTGHVQLDGRYIDKVFTVSCRDCTFTAPVKIELLRVIVSGNPGDYGDSLEETRHFIHDAMRQNGRTFLAGVMARTTGAQEAREAARRAAEERREQEEHEKLPSVWDRLDGDDL